MTDHEKDFLLSEFNKAWDQLFNIDNRRGIFSRHLTILVMAVIAVAAKFVLDADQVSLSLALSLSIVFGVTVVAAYTTMGILESERDANLRYRAKINLIRELFLKGTVDENVKAYISQKNERIGIKLFTGVDQPSGDGGTLFGIFKFIRLEIFAMYALIICIWALYLLPFLTF